MNPVDSKKKEALALKYTTWALNAFAICGEKGFLPYSDPETKRGDLEKLLKEIFENAIEHK